MTKFGHMGEDEYVELGINAKLSELHAAMGLAVLPKVPDIIAQRKECAQWYDENLAGCGLMRPAMVAGLEYNFAYYPVIFPTHETMMQARKALFDNDVGPRRYFHPSLNTLPYLRAEGQKPCPVSESVSDRVLCLPLFVGLEQRDVAEICTITRAAIA
jgi:dTDP-4-amino-4,6-dideoxygalactose transaminase